MTDSDLLDPKDENSVGGIEDRISTLLATVGQRVRKMRGKIGLSRRMLSEHSGVSQRYLAQLETGQGNISLALLMRIADALDTRVDVLVREAETPSSRPRDLWSRVANASATQQAQILALLDPDGSLLRKGRRIALIGLRGAGKSTLGELAAHKLGVRFLELNTEIESASGIAVEEVIALYGQEGYRHLELQALERVAATHDELVLAVAGGIVSQPETYQYLLNNYHTIWLKAAPEEHMDRVRAQGDERPMAGNPDAMSELRRILEDRETLYGRASMRLDTSSSSLDDTLDRLVTLISNEEYLRA